MGDSKNSKAVQSIKAPISQKQGEDEPRLQELARLIVKYAADGLYYQAALIAVLLVSAFVSVFQNNAWVTLTVFGASLLAIVYLAKSVKNQ